MDFSTVASGLAGGFIGAVAAYWLVSWRRSSVLGEVGRVVDDHEDRIISIENTFRSAKGVQAREDKTAEFELAMAELMPLLQEEGDMQSKISKALPILAKYPRVRSMVLKQLGLSI